VISHDIFGTKPLIDLLKLDFQYLAHESDDTWKALFLRENGEEVVGRGKCPRSAMHDAVNTEWKDTQQKDATL
jgi:hypothetical protein